MARHILKLHYDGLLAARHELAPSASKQVVQGAQMFLGAHAHYYLSGTVPDRINDKGPGYEIVDLARTAGSWQAEFAINILSQGIWDTMKFGFVVFLLDSYRAWAEGRLFEDPPFERREPFLEGYSGNREPVFDSLPRRQYYQRRLSRRVGLSVAHMTAPNGTSSSVLEMSFDGQVFAVIDRRIPIYSEEEITEAVSLFRESIPPGIRFS